MADASGLQGHRCTPWSCWRTSVGPIRPPGRGFGLCRVSRVRRMGLGSQQIRLEKGGNSYGDRVKSRGRPQALDRSFLQIERNRRATPGSTSPLLPSGRPLRQGLKGSTTAILQSSRGMPRGRQGHQCCDFRPFLADASRLRGHRSTPQSCWRTSVGTTTERQGYRYGS